MRIMWEGIFMRICKRAFIFLIVFIVLSGYTAVYAEENGFTKDWAEKNILLQKADFSGSKTGSYRESLSDNWAYVYDYFYGALRDYANYTEEADGNTVITASLKVYDRDYDISPYNYQLDYGDWRLDHDTMFLLVNMIACDHPEIFWTVDTSESIYTAMAYNCTDGHYEFYMKAKAMGSVAELGEYQRKINEVKADIISGAMAVDNLYDRVKYIHDSICGYGDYDWETINGERGTGHNVVGLFENRLGVCEAFSNAFKMLCDECGIDCVFVRCLDEYHGWNYVRMEDGKWYAVDLTLDGQTPETFHNYFLKGAEDFFEDHHMENPLMLDFSQEDYVPDGGFEDRTIKLFINSYAIDVFGRHFDNDSAPVIVNSRTMLPVRPVAEALGGRLEWDGEQRKAVIISPNGDKIDIFADSDRAYINGRETKLDCAAFVSNGRTYLPLRFAAEAMGASVEWEPDLKRITITKQ